MMRLPRRRRRNCPAGRRLQSGGRGRFTRAELRQQPLTAKLASTIPAGSVTGFRTRGAVQPPWRTITLINISAARRLL